MKTKKKLVLSSTLKRKQILFFCLFTSMGPIWEYEARNENRLSFKGTKNQKVIYT